MKPPAIHLRGPRGKPACGFRRWASQSLTTNGNPKRVTCRRKGCAAGAPQETMAPVDASATIEIVMPSKVTVLVYPSSTGPHWVSHVIIQTADTETGDDGYFGSEWKHPAQPSTAVIAEHVALMMTHEIEEQLGLNPHAVKDPSA